jgi:hypothetical protein
VNPEFGERVAHGCDDIIQALMPRDTPRAAFLVRGRISHTLEAILARFANEATSRRGGNSIALSAIERL